MHRLASISIVFALAAGVSSAQSQQPYAGLEGRPIKALSEQQISDLRAGRGMGLALAARLHCWQVNGRVRLLVERVCSNWVLVARAGHRSRGRCIVLGSPNRGIG
jgi:hypothetical protein